MSKSKWIHNLIGIICAAPGLATAAPPPDSADSAEKHGIFMVIPGTNFPCAHRLVVANNGIQVKCANLGELAAEISRLTHWQLRFTRAPTDNDMLLGGWVDLAKIAILVEDLEWMGAVRIISLDRAAQTALLTPIPSLPTAVPDTPRNSTTTE